LGCYGQKHIETPHLDRLYREGMRFTQAYAGACECAPTRCSLITGKHMGHARIRLNRSVRGQDHLLDEDVTVAEVLKQAGYATAFCGKWGIGTPGTEGVPYKQGFDLAFGYYDQRRAHTFFPEFLYRNEQKVELRENVGFDMSRAYRHTRDDSAHKHDSQGNFIAEGVKDPKRAIYSENLICDEALRFIRLHRDGPFFLYYATQLPHGPVVTPNLGRHHRREGFPDLRHREWAASRSKGRPAFQPSVFSVSKAFSASTAGAFQSAWLMRKNPTDCRERWFRQPASSFPRLRRPCIAASPTTARQKCEKWHEPINFRTRRKNLLPNAGNLPILGIGSLLHGLVPVQSGKVPFQAHNMEESPSFVGFQGC